MAKIIVNRSARPQDVADVEPGHPATANGLAAITPEQRHQGIAEGAYLRAAARGFLGGDPVLDWLEAESDFDASAEHALARAR